MKTNLIYIYVMKWNEVKVAQSCLTLCDPMGYTVHGILLARLLEWVAFPFSRGSSQPRDRTQVSCIAGGFFTSWTTREAPKHWAGSLSLLQWIFPTQGSNQGLLHYRRIFTDWAIREYWITLLYAWNTVHQLYFNKKKIHEKKYFKI